MATPAARLVAVQALLIVGGAVVLGRSFQLQVVQHAQWEARARALRTESDTIDASRGTIFDRNGVPLAETQEAYRITLAKNEFTDSAEVVRQLVRLPGFTAERVAKAMTKRYPNFYDELSAEEIAPLVNLKGVHFDVIRRRVYPLEQLARPLLGRLDDKGRASGGVERMLDTLLTGTPGLAIYLRDSRSNVVKIPSSIIRAPVAGKDVYLTIDYALQGIAEGELSRALAEYQAKGGDVVVLDVKSGELLASASIRTDTATGRLVANLGAIGEANEPGSTAKLFTAAAVLREGADTTPVSGEGGIWRLALPGGKSRSIEDVHAESGLLTLGEIIKVSSNIGISKFGLRLTREQQFLALRDFGFGAPPMLGIPGETAGSLRNPGAWDIPVLSQPSISQGYFFEASAIQLASAYAAIANEGRLMAPSILREVRDGGEKTVRWRHTPVQLREAVTPKVAHQLMSYLRLATDTGGSGAKAQLDRATVVGKTGTAKVLVGKGYTIGVYRGSFAGLYPGEAPEVVVYVMIDRPSGMAFYGGLVAAPMVRNILQQSLASRTSPLDRRSVEAPVTARREAPLVVTPGGAARQLAFPLTPAKAAPEGTAAVPIVQGLPVRDAIVALHRAGYQVRLVGRAAGLARTTLPVGGDTLPRARVVTLYADSLP
jgi:cell division protein FtsI (penicillin-binding protein 3)